MWFYLFSCLVYKCLIIAHVALFIIIFSCYSNAVVHSILFLQCFDAAVWVIRPVNTRPDMTCNVFGGTLNLTPTFTAYQYPGPD